jgi:hypothetical protein
MPQPKPGVSRAACVAAGNCSGLEAKQLHQCIFFKKKQHNSSIHDTRQHTTILAVRAKPVAAMREL